MRTGPASTSSDAASITNTPAGNIAATTVQAALNELDNEKLKKAGGDALTGGFTSASVDQGTKSSGTFTPSLAAGAVQHYANGGAHTLAPPADEGSMILDQINNASAGAVTRTGFTKTSGDALTTTNGDKFRHFISKGNAGSLCQTVKMT